MKIIKGFEVDCLEKAIGNSQKEMQFEFETRTVHSGDDPQKRKSRKPTIILDCIDGEESVIGNESKERLEKCIASLEYAKYCLCFPSGMGAITSISMMVENGDHVIVFDSVYHGTRTLLGIKELQRKVEVEYVDLRNPSLLEEHMKPNTKMVWFETPCNPTMKIVDIAKVSEIVKRHGRAFSVVDNTFMTPFFQNLLLLGADVVMHSLTKYMNGHSDIVMGTAATNREDLYMKLKKYSISIGSFPSPMDCYLCLRGLKTLHLRMRRHMENGLEVAKYLEKHPKVTKLFYPGLLSHPQHALAKKQSRGFNGMVAFCINGGERETREFAKRIKVFTLGGSLGNIESLVDITRTMTGKILSKEVCEQMGIPDNLIRLSVGLEDVKDLIADLDQALAVI